MLTSNNVPTKLVLFPDTNIFIEAKDLRELPWEELASEEITLQVCPAVLTEIDEHKTSPKNRVKERARKWNSEFKKLFKPAAPPLVLKGSSPRVSLEILNTSLVGPSQSTLDLNKPDNQLVDWALRYRHSNPDEDARLFTDDTGPLGKANELKLPFLDLPTHWRPELGPSEEQKEIENLKQKLKLYQDNCPKPLILIVDKEGAEIQVIELTVYRYRSLRSDEVEALINELKQHDPPPIAEQLKSPSSSPGQFSGNLVWRPPGDQRISKFLNEEYPAWLDQTKNVLFQLGSNLGLESLIGHFGIALTNDGVCPALSTKLIVKASGHFSFLKKPASLFTQPEMPKRPFPPYGKFVDPILESFKQAIPSFDLPNVDSLNLPDFSWQQRDKNAWYLDEEQGQSSYTTETVFTCDEWRHHEKPFEEVFWFKLDQDCVAGSAGVVSVTLHANNLPEPVKKTVKIEVAIENLDVVQQARRLLHL